jgi:hypothetical protein
MAPSLSAGGGLQIPVTLAGSASKGTTNGTGVALGTSEGEPAGGRVPSTEANGDATDGEALQAVRNTISTNLTTSSRTRLPQAIVIAF